MKKHALIVLSGAGLVASMARAVCIDGPIELTVEDKITEGYCKLLLEGPYALQVSFSGVDEEGRFELAARPGTYRLVINAGPGHYQYKTVTDLVELQEGDNTWERDLPVDLWDGEGIRLDE